MKKILLLVSIACAITTVSCKKTIEEDNRSLVSEEYLNSAEGFQSAVNGSYSFLKNFYGREQGASLTVFGTDEFTNGGDGSYKAFNTYDANLNPTASLINYIWDNFYLGINTFNGVITRAPNVTGIAESVKKTLVAEVQFLRAQWYFILVRIFGPVHLTLTETQGIERTASRASVNEIYAAIIKDLESAISALPVVSASYGRVTRPAAENLLAKVYLTKATSEAKDAADYDKAAELAKKVINDYNFQLLTDYGKIFEQTNEKNSEVIWAVQNNSNLLTNGVGNILHNSFNPRYYDAPGMVVDLENGQPYRRFVATTYVLESLFDRNHDDRYLKSFKRVWYVNLPGTYTINGKSVTLKLGDTASYYPDTEWTQSQINSKKYTVYTPSKLTELYFPALNKFFDPKRSDIQQERGTRDVLVYRLAETYLIAAEALMMKGKLTEAATLVNVVRTRAAKAGATPTETQANIAAMQISPAQLNIDFILEERSRELLGENMRWFDLVRTGKLLERVKKYNPVAAARIQPFHILRPIPQTQIDRTTGPFLQNPGYN